MERVFTDECKKQLLSLVDLKECTHGQMPDYELDSYMNDVFAIIGQSSLPKERLDRAPHLRAIFNVEGNFFQNIDYDTCFKRNIYVLNCGNAFGVTVAEMALCFALDLTRGVTREDRRFREGKETYFDKGNLDTVLLHGATVGLIGFGNVGKKLREFLAPFRCHIMVCDPWIPDSILKDFDCVPVSLEKLLSTSQFIFVVAGVTTENQSLLGAKEFEFIRPGSNVILVSRAALVDFDEFAKRVEDGQFKGATDVFPTEPVPQDHPIRKNVNMLLSPHRAGDTPQALKSVGDMVLDDLKLIMKGLPPQRMQAAKPETIKKLRSIPTDFQND
jgi:phosphoglycerate dehydrogenase-like enzyme